jgi:hypothetical protein
MPKDHTGSRFGRLILIKRIPEPKKDTKYLCQCDCGKTIVCLGSNLVSGRTKSCGCWKSENSSNMMKKVLESSVNKILNPGHLEIYIDENDCHICYSHKRTKYGHIYIMFNKKQHLLHRLVYEKENGKIPDNMIIRHTCDKGDCINPNHLIIGTHEDNVKDRVERGRSAIGENNGRSKLKPGQVCEIRKSNLPPMRLAEIYNVDRKAIIQIIERKTWKHI